MGVKPKQRNHILFKFEMIHKKYSISLSIDFYQIKPNKPKKNIIRIKT